MSKRARISLLGIAFAFLIISPVGTAGSEASTGGEVGSTSDVANAAVCAHSARAEVDGVAGMVHVYTYVTCTRDGDALEIEAGGSEAVHDGIEMGRTYMGPVVSFPNDGHGRYCVPLTSQFFEVWPEELEYRQTNACGSV